MTSPGKNYPGQKGFPTPNETPEETACLVFIIPASNDWTGLLLGAVGELLNPYNYYFWGDVTPEEAADKWQEIILEATANNSCAAVVPAPWWDDESGDDSDDEASREMQPWYGNIVILDDELTFVENVFIWAVAGFIAYSGAVGAAISFVPIARRFVVTVKSNPLGGIIRFFADAVEIGSVDTYSPTDMATEVSLALPETMSFVAEDAPTFWAMLTDENPHGLESVSATIIRSRLSENDFSPADLRYNEGTDTVEFSPDGGETWIPDPGDDPRVGSKFAKPTKTGSDIACRSAASMVMWVRGFIEYETGVLELGGGAAAVGNAMLTLLSPIAPYAVLFKLVFGVAEALFSIGSTALETAFTDETYDLMLCAFDCNVQPDGTVSDENFAAMQEDMEATLNTTAWIVMALILGAQGRMGVQNAGTLYEVESPDCSECDCGWTYRWDFTASDGGWFPRDANEATYIPGTGWVANCVTSGVPGRRVVIQYNIPTAPAVAIEDYQASITYVQGTASTPDPRQIVMREFSANNGGGSVLASSTSSVPLPSGDYIGELASNQTPHSLEFNCWSTANTNCSGSVIVHYAQVSGSGTPPSALTGGAFI